MLKKLRKIKMEENLHTFRFEFEICICSEILFLKLSKTAQHSVHQRSNRRLFTESDSDTVYHKHCMIGVRVRKMENYTPCYAREKISHDRI